MTCRGNSNGNPAISINVEQFIQDIECRPAIWNRNYHCNKQFLELTWIELSKLYNLPCQTLKAKWKGLRDNFRVEYKRIPRDENGEMMINPEYYESKWVHYRPLLFLVEHMRHRTIKIEHSNLSNILIENTATDNEECVVEPDLAHGLVHNDYTSDGQNDDDNDESMNITSPTTIQNSSRNNNGNPLPLLKRKRQSNDHDSSSIVLDIIKTEPAECNELRKSLNPNNNINLNNSNNNSVSKLKLRQIRSNSNRIQQQQQQQQDDKNLIEYKNNLSNNNNDNSMNVGSSQQQIEKPTTMIATSSTARKINLCNDREDDDYHYLMSLHPYMNKLQPSQKLRVRTKIQKLILKELYKEDLD